MMTSPTSMQPSRSLMHGSTRPRTCLPMHRSKLRWLMPIHHHNWTSSLWSMAVMLWS